MLLFWRLRGVVEYLFACVCERRREILLYEVATGRLRRLYEFDESTRADSHEVGSETKVDADWSVRSVDCCWKPYIILSPTNLLLLSRIMLGHNR